MNGVLAPRESNFGGFVDSIRTSFVGSHRIQLILCHQLALKICLFPQHSLPPGWGKQAKIHGKKYGPERQIACQLT